MRGRNHSREFKLEVCHQVASGAKRPAQICREHQLGESLLLRWRREYEQRGAAAFSPPEPSGAAAVERRLAELERCCGQLAHEHALLKKAWQTTGCRSGMR
jgi:transposase-like protein